MTSFTPHRCAHGKFAAGDPCHSLGCFRRRRLFICHSRLKLSSVGKQRGLWQQQDGADSKCSKVYHDDLLSIQGSSTPAKSWPFGRVGLLFISFTEKLSKLIFMARLDLLTWSEIGAASSVHFPPLRAAFLIHCIFRCALIWESGTVENNKRSLHRPVSV